MTVDPVQFCEARLPSLFEVARLELEAAAQRGDSVASARLSALTADKVRTRVRFAGGDNDELWLLTDRSGLAVQRTAPVQVGFGYAVEIARGAAVFAIDMLERQELEPERIARGLLVMGSERARALFSAARVAFDVTILNVPVAGEITLRLGLGRTDLPARPDFSVEVEYDELEDARERGTPPHQIFLQGKMRVDGDASRHALAMTWPSSRSACDSMAIRSHKHLAPCSSAARRATGLGSAVVPARADRDPLRAARGALRLRPDARALRIYVALPTPVGAGMDPALVLVDDTLYWDVRRARRRRPPLGALGR